MSSTKWTSSSRLNVTLSNHDIAHLGLKDNHSLTYSMTVNTFFLKIISNMYYTVYINAVAWETSVLKKNVISTSRIHMFWFGQLLFMVFIYFIKTWHFLYQSKFKGYHIN